MTLIIFDCDGTLVDSQGSICAAMEHAFTSLRLAVPSRADILRIVGLSLPQAFAALAPQHPLGVQRDLAELYRAGFGRRVESVPVQDPLFAGMAEVVESLAGRPDAVLGIATGKSRRGIARVLDREGWSRHFLTIQTADDNPSKPHPAMILRAMAEGAVEPAETVMIGDSTYDMEMARNAGVGAVGVAWGYHDPEHLRSAGAHAVAARSDTLIAAIDRVLAKQGRCA
jgi:phosphoglycolate phosphatase